MATVSCGTTSEKFEFIARNRELGVSRLCDWFEISRSGFYAWDKRGESQRARDDRELCILINKIYKDSGGTYGSPRVFEALKKQGISVSEKRVERLMREVGLVGRVVTVTRRQPGLKRFKEAGENLRLGAPEVDGLNQQWVADVTYLKLNGIWIYLAVVMDVYSRRILGWSLAKHRTTELTLAAFGYALKKRQVAPGCLFHTDRGIEYTAFRFRDAVTDKVLGRVSTGQDSVLTMHTWNHFFIH